MQAVRIDGGLAFVRGREGFFLVPRNDIYIGAAIEAYGEYSPDECRFLCELLKEGDCVIEVGPSIGALTIPMAKKIGKAGMLWTYEPQKFFFAFLQAQIALNRAHNIIARNVACWEKPATLWMPNVNPDAPANFGSLNTVAFEMTADMIPVTATSLDEDIPSDIVPALIKADVEGSEMAVLAGARGLIERHRPLLYVENDRPDKAQALIKFIADLGYRLWWHTPPLFSEENFFGTRINLYKNIVSFNMICIHESKVEGYPKLTSALAIVDPLSSIPAAMSCEAKP